MDLLFLFVGFLFYSVGDVMQLIAAIVKQCLYLGDVRAYYNILSVIVSIIWLLYFIPETSKE